MNCDFDTLVLVQLLMLAGRKSFKETAGSSSLRAAFEFSLCQAHMKVHSTGPRVEKAQSGLHIVPLIHGWNGRGILSSKKLQNDYYYWTF